LLLSPLGAPFLLRLLKKCLRPEECQGIRLSAIEVRELCLLAGPLCLSSLLERHDTVEGTTVAMFSRWENSYLSGYFKRR
jgi:hypothetical protein